MKVSWAVAALLGLLASDLALSAGPGSADPGGLTRPAASGGCLTVDPGPYASPQASVHLDKSTVAAGDKLTVSITYDASAFANKQVHLFCSAAFLQPATVDGVPVSPEIGLINFDIRDYRTLGLPQPDDATVGFDGGEVPFNDVAAHHTVVFTINPAATDTCTTLVTPPGGDPIYEGPWVVLSQDSGVRRFESAFSTAVPFEIKNPALGLTVSATSPVAGEARPGDVLRYTIDARPKGQAKSLTVKNPIPPGTDLVPNSIQGGGKLSGNAITWHFTNVGRQKMFFQAKVQDASKLPLSLRSIDDTATAQAVIDTGHASQSAGLSLPIPRPPLLVHITPATHREGQAAAGETVHYTVKVTPPGPVQNGTLADTLPDPKAATLLPNSITGGGSASRGKITWTFSGPDPFEAAFDVRVQDAAKLPRGLDHLTDTAHAEVLLGSSEGTSGDDSATLRLAVPVVVTLTSDEPAADPATSPLIDPAQPDKVTLRSAIQYVNASEGSVTVIGFDIQAGNGNLFDGPYPRIQPAQALPAIQGPATIDGASQPSGRVEIAGLSAPAGTAGLAAAGSGVLFRGLAVNRFNGAGLELGGAGGHRVEGCYLGTDATGSKALGRDGEFGNEIGVRVVSSGNTVGGAGVKGNVISGNRVAGVGIDFDAAGTRVLGNFIGTDAGGTKPISNTVGVRCYGSGNFIGGLGSGEGNVISGNIPDVHEATSGAGVAIGSGASGNQVAGNRIGLDATGKRVMTNGLHTFSGSSDTDPTTHLMGGVVVEGDHNQIGPGNAIAGNYGSDVLLANPSATGNVVQGNLIQVDITGLRETGPVYRFYPREITLSTYPEIGVAIADARDNTIGGPGMGQGNVVGSIEIISHTADAGDQATGNVVQGNLIGIDRTGRHLLKPGDGAQRNTTVAGIVISNAPSNTLGGPGAGAGNSIAGTEFGIQVIADTGSSPVAGNVIQGNFIGTNAQHDPLGVDRDGILLVRAAQTLIGGSHPGEGNTVSFCSQQPNASGQTNAAIRFADSSGNQVAGNRLTENGASAVGLDFPGSGLEQSTGNSIRSNAVLNNGLKVNAPPIDLQGYQLHQSPAVGPNLYQNPPSQLKGVSDGTTTRVTGLLVGSPALTTVTLEFFSSHLVRGRVEAEKPLGTLQVQTDFIGRVDSFQFDVPNSALIAVGKKALITAIATDAAGNSSEVSLPAEALLVP